MEIVDRSMYVDRLLAGRMAKSKRYPSTNGYLNLPLHLSQPYGRAMAPNGPSWEPGTVPTPLTTPFATQPTPHRTLIVPLSTTNLKRHAVNLNNEGCGRPRDLLIGLCTALSKNHRIDRQ